MFSALEFEVLFNGFEKVKLNSNAKFVDNILEIFQQWWKMRRLSDLHCEIIRCYIICIILIISQIVYLKSIL